MFDYTKGGRGKKAPYESITKRVPLPLSDAVDEMVLEFRQQLLSGDENKPVTGKDLVIQKLQFIIESVEANKPGYKPKSATRLVKAILELKDNLQNL